YPAMPDGRLPRPRRHRRSPPRGAPAARSPGPLGARRRRPEVKVRPRDRADTASVLCATAGPAIGARLERGDRRADPLVRDGLLRAEGLREQAHPELLEQPVDLAHVGIRATAGGELRPLRLPVLREVPDLP